MPLDKIVVDIPQNPAETIAEFREALVWLESFSINTRSGRLKTYAEFCERFESQDLRREAAPNLIFLVEIAQVVDIWQNRAALATLHDFDRRLTEIASGNPFYRDDRNHRARNLLFELMAACFLLDLGMRLLPTKDGDLDAEMIGRRFHIECKRPLSEGKLGRNVREASKKIGDRRTGRAVGIVLVDMTLLLNRDLKQWLVDSDEAAINTLDAHLEQIKYPLHANVTRELRSADDAFVGCYFWLPCWNSARDNWSIQERWLMLGNPKRSPMADHWYDTIDRRARERLLAHVGTAVISPS